MSYAITVGRWLLRVRPAPLGTALKRLLLVRRVECATAEGVFWIDPGSYLGSTLAETGEYEPATLAILKSLLRPGDAFVDVGANEGYFSVVAARRVGPAGRVIAVEPQTRLQPILRRNFALNACPQVEVMAAAISDRPGQAELHLTPDMNNSASGLAQSTRYRVRTETIPCLTLEEIFRARNLSSAVVKMDIESWEYEAILGSPELFRSGRIRALVLELHPELLAARGLRVEDIAELLSACGYRLDPASTGLAWIRHE